MRDDQSSANIERKIQSSGLLQTKLEGIWVNKIDCEVCYQTHFSHAVQISDVAAASQPSPRGAVRLSDGFSHVDIVYEALCVDEPFENLAKSLSRTLKMPVISAHQVFDSIDQLAALLEFSIPGDLFASDEPRMSLAEQYEVETGHLLKMNYRQTPESELLDIIIEFEEFEFQHSDYVGEKVRAFGLEITLAQGSKTELQAAGRVFQRVLDSYVQLLAPAVNEEYGREIKLPNK